MKLTELLLNRFLYKDNLQNLETKDSIYTAGNAIEADVPAVASGGAAQDINTSNVTINGQQLTPGTYPVTVLDVSNWGWGQTCVFSSTDLDTVSWTLGVFKSADGTSYNITAGATGNMAAKTYIYLDLLTSTTTYQTTTTPANAVGVGKVLIAVAVNATAGNLATYNLSEATQIVGDNILANSINASKITTGQLIVGTNVGLGAAKQNFYATPTTPYYLNDLWTSGTDIRVCIVQRLSGAYVAADWVLATNYQNPTGVTTIVGNTVTTGFVNALSVTAGSVAAENITGTTITGKTVQTSSSGIRTVLDGSDDKLKFMSGATVWAFIEPQAFGTLNGLYIASGAEDAWIRVVEGADNLVSMRNSDGAYVSVFNDSVLINATDVGVTGDLSTQNIFADDIYCLKLILETVGYVYSDGSEGTPFPSVAGWSVTYTATGRYRVNHPLNTFDYTVVITPVAAAAKIWCIATRDDDYFDVRIGNSTGTLEDNDFMFQVIQNQ